MWFGNWLRLHLTPRRHYSPAHTPNGWYVCIFGAFEVYFDRRLKYLLSIWIQTDFLCHMSSKCPTWHNIHIYLRLRPLRTWWVAGGIFRWHKKTDRMLFLLPLRLSRAHAHKQMCTPMAPAVASREIKTWVWVMSASVAGSSCVMFLFGTQGRLAF